MTERTVMEKRKHRFNIVDAVVVLLVAAVLVFAVVKAVGKEKEVRRGVTFVMQTSMLPDELSDNVSSGDPVYDADSGRKIGTVAACEARPAQHVGSSAAGTRTVSEVIGYKTLYVTCEAEVSLADGEYRSDGVALSSGKSYVLMFPSLYCEAECISVAENAGD